MMRPNIADLVKLRDQRLAGMGAIFEVQDDNGLRRILLGDHKVDVHVTTGSWSIVGQPDLHMNDWEGALDYLALRL